MKRPFSALFLTLALGCPAGDDGDTNDTGANDDDDGSGTVADDDGMDDGVDDDGGSDSSGADSSGGDGGDDDGPSLEANGCTKDDAMDLTGMAAVDIDSVSPWALGHQACIIVDAGTTVSWTGDFTAHPLVGGEVPNADFSSVISTAANGASGETTVDVTFDDAGDYPYFCLVHVAGMEGVVYVE